MKHTATLYLIMMVFAASSLHAQTEKGQFVIGAGTSIDLSKTESNAALNTTSLNMKANGGYFIVDNLSVGISGSLKAAYGNANVDGIENTDILSEFRYYFNGTHFRPFVQMNAGYRYARLVFTSTDYTAINKAHGLALGGGVGGAFFIRDNISIDLGLQYLHANLKRSTIPYGMNGPIQEEKPFKAVMDDLKLSIGFSMYL